MKKNLLLGLALTGAVLSTPAAYAEIGTIDAVPAATLLLPYFEVDLVNPAGVTTLFSINNASASAALAHVTLWTDESVPTLNFDVYLTGYDVQTINLRDIFNGNLPRTADDGEDPTDTISPQGPLSQDINFSPSNPPASVQLAGPCDSPYVNPALGAAFVTHIRAAHQGLPSAFFGNNCSGAAWGDGRARGYITVDTVTQCNVSFPNSASYFSGGVADNRNILWGDYFYVDSANNFAQGDVLVHIESCQGNLYVGNKAGHCPFVPGDYTFYGRYASVAGQDQREPLATTFATRYLNGGAFSGGTDVLVWRDAKSAADPSFACGTNAAWAPLPQAQVVAFDETENPTELCASNICFPFAAARVGTQVTLGTVSPFGWLFLDLNHSGTAQAWVTPVMDAEGRFSVGFHATALDTALAPNSIILPVP
jgi:hypothetical protein